MTSLEETLVRRADILLAPDPGRVLARPFLPGKELVLGGTSRADAVFSRVLVLSDDVVRTTLAQVRAGFEDRHADLDVVLTTHADRIAELVLPGTSDLSADRRRLMGAYATMEYAIEGSALCNPSMVRHPDQSGLGENAVRVLFSARAVGEGHISSIEFRTGVLEGPEFRLDPPAPQLTQGTLASIGPHSLPGRDVSGERYRRTFGADVPISSRILFPTVAAERQGMEDARWTRFVHTDGRVEYLGTYTAFDGHHIAPRLLRTTDFADFESHRMVGRAAKDKGMALFPRQVAGRYLAINRSDRESIGVTSSSDAVRWDVTAKVQSPTLPWELIQLGNCGPPIETEQGWLVITHGVGPMRRYAIGAMLLDLEDPTQLIGALSQPLITPQEDERDGYVPNVVYSCGAMRHGDTLLVPYGCSDATIRFAFVDLPGLLQRLN